MNRMPTNENMCAGRGLLLGIVASAGLLAVHAQAAVPGITGTSFNLVATEAHISQPDGQTVYSWGYGCSATAGAPSFLPSNIGTAQGANCTTMQIPGPTLIVHQNDVVTVTLTNNLPAAAGNTSILFPGFTVTANPLPGVAGLLTREAAHNGQVSYTFVATNAGTHVYYSGTQSDLQVEMGLYGAIVVLPTAANTANCTALGAEPTRVANADRLAEAEFRLAKSAYDHAGTCYDREYLFQFSEIDSRIHRQAEEQVLAGTASLAVETEPYHATYFMINGRSMPDDMDPHYAFQYPHQPYNGNPHMHPGELVLLRIIGTGRLQHPFHEHGNHVRVLARDGNLLLATDPANPGQLDPQQRLAGPLLFTTTTTPGEAMDGIFYWTGKGLNWDVYAHTPGTAPCRPDPDGYFTIRSTPPAPVTAPNYYEWCADHEKALEKNPFGDVPTGGPVTLPDPNIFALGPWYGGSPYMGPDATGRSMGPTPIPPSGTVANDPGGEAGFAFMWHSHNEREITTNNSFPGGMMMMMLVDPQAFLIDEVK